MMGFHGDAAWITGVLFVALALVAYVVKRRRS